AETANLTISNFNSEGVTVEKTVFAGNGFNDTAPVITTGQLGSVPSQLSLSPVSLTILNFKQDLGNTTVENPAGEQMMLYFDGKNLQMEKPLITEGKLSVYRIDGQLVNQIKLSPDTKSVDLSGLNNGIYLVRVQTGNMYKSIKILIL
ncbi:MAG: T9SS type A sorting domain-containing protein, partial [Paludibacter sp.]|nr:T9SS type A sorting domain-containing protein [Paludibacter sp.]